jgi:hypothetical protein
MTPKELYVQEKMKKARKIYGNICVAEVALLLTGLFSWIWSDWDWAAKISLTALIIMVFAKMVYEGIKNHHEDQYDKENPTPKTFLEKLEARKREAAK